MKVNSESEVVRDPMDCSLPGSSVHGIFQARVLEWGAIAFSTLKVYVLPSHFLCMQASKTQVGLIPLDQVSRISR